MKIIRDLKQKKKFLKIIEKNFSKICIAYDGTKLKYCDILSYTIQINKYLVKNSLENKTVITQFKNRLHAFIFYIAAIFSKTTICPLDPKLPPYRVNKIKRLIVNKNNKANLLNLCEKCHDEIHKTNKKYKKTKATIGIILEEI